MAEQTQYERSCGAVVFCETDGKRQYVLVREREGFWSFPKGHMEAGETARETALREIREETGLDVELIAGFQTQDEHPLAREGRPHVIKQILYFLARCENRQPVAQESEIAEVRLMDYDAAMAAFQFDSSKRILTEAHLFLNGGLEKKT